MHTHTALYKRSTRCSQNQSIEPMVKMTAFFSVIATLCLTVVTTANENPPGRCCPNKFEVDPDPAD